MRDQVLRSGLVAAALATTATASEISFNVQESFSFSNVESLGERGDALNARFSRTATGGYLADQIRLSGTLTEVRMNTFASEADIALSTNAGDFTLNGSSVNRYSGTIQTETALDVSSFDPAGPLTFEFFESFDDGDGADQIWDEVTIEFITTSVTNGMFDLGALAGDGSPRVERGTNVRGGLDLYTFELPSGVNAGDYLNLQTFNPDTGALLDSEIALYDADGNFIATDDDGQDAASGDLYSMLSFGSADPLTGTDTAAGSDGETLAAGQYTLVVGGFNTVFGARLDDITPGEDAGDYDLQLAYVPEPASGVLLLTLLLIRRR